MSPHFSQFLCQNSIVAQIFFNFFLNTYPNLYITLVRVRIYKHYIVTQIDWKSLETAMNKQGRRVLEMSTKNEFHGLKILRQFKGKCYMRSESSWLKNRQTATSRHARQMHPMTG